MDLAAVGSRAVLDFEVSSTGAQRLLTSEPDGALPFSERAEPDLIDAPAFCELQAPSTALLVAKCPTGMDDTYSQSTNGGRTFRQFWDVGGTVGAVLDVVSAELLYRFTGVVGPSALQRSTDGGRSFVTVRRLTQRQAVSALVFVDHDDGYALGGDGLLHTTDGGRSFESVRLG